MRRNILLPVCGGRPRADHRAVYQIGPDRIAWAGFESLLHLRETLDAAFAAVAINMFELMRALAIGLFPVFRGAGAGRDAPRHAGTWRAGGRHPGVRAAAGRAGAQRRGDLPCALDRRVPAGAGGQHRHDAATECAIRSLPPGRDRPTAPSARRHARKAQARRARDVTAKARLPPGGGVRTRASSRTPFGLRLPTPGRNLRRPQRRSTPQWI